LQAGSQVRRFADNAALLGFPRPDQIADNHETGRDTDSRLQRCTGLQSGDCSDRFQSRTDRAFGVVLVGFRVSEIDQDPVAHILGNEPAEPAHHRGNTLR
jgi:hypothetical protein